jgi:hypothetical protein
MASFAVKSGQASLRFERFDQGDGVEADYVRSLAVTHPSVVYANRG